MKFKSALNRVMKNISKGKRIKYYIYLEEDKQNKDKWIEVDDSFIYNTDKYVIEDFVTRDTWHTKEIKTITL